MRRILKWLGLGFGFLIAAIVVLYWMLLPPALDVPPQVDITFSNVTVLNPSVSVQEHQTVVVSDGRIAQVRPYQSSDPDPICDGCIVMPGLIDAHVHTPPKIALGNQELFSLMYLLHGVTSVRDVGASDGSILTLRVKLNRGDMVGPRMFACGPVLEGDPPVWPMGDVLTTPEAGEAKVNELAKLGVDCIKVYNALSQDVFDAIASAASAHDLPLIGHVPHDVGLRNVENFEVQHVTGIPYAHGKEAPALLDWADEDFNAVSDVELAEVVSLSRSQGLSYLPTLINAQRRLIASDSERWPHTEMTNSLPAFWPLFWQVGMGHPEGEKQIADREDAILNLRRVMKALHDGDIDILAGTDTLMPFVLPGEALIDEIDEIALVLGSNEAALASATTINGKHIARNEIGSVRIGARADLLVLKSDPREDLNALRDWDVLIADGRLYERDTLDASMATYQRHFHGPLYSALVSLIIRFVGDDYASAQDGG